MSEKLKTIKIIHLAICSGVIVIYSLLGDITSFNKLINLKIDSSSASFLLIPLAAVFLSNYLYKSQINKVDPKLVLEEKIPVYHIATIIRLAILEGAAFMILFLKPDFILLGIFLILYIIYLRPSEERFRKDLETKRH